MKYLTNSENVCQHFISKVFFQLSTIESFHEFYSELIHKQLDLMGLTYCEILNEINLSQVNLKSNIQPNTLGKAQCAMVWLEGTFAFCPQKSLYIHIHYCHQTLLKGFSVAAGEKFTGWRSSCVQPCSWSVLHSSGYDQVDHLMWQ